MIRFFSNRELSEKLSIRLSKWKRWSREFLPPDPLGGLQSGYARQYTTDQAFAVFLGGHLVADLHFSIPEARTILEDLNTWVSTRKAKWTEKTEIDSHEETLVYIFRKRSGASKKVRFAYLERIRLLDEPWVQSGKGVRHEVYVEVPIQVTAAGHENMKADNPDKINARILHASRLYEGFSSLF